MILGRRRTCPPTRLCERGDHRRFPCSPCHRSVRSASSSTPAASPCLRRRPSTGPPHRCIIRLRSRPRPQRGSRTAHRPVSTRFEPALRLRGFNHWFASLYLLTSLAGPAPLAVPARPGVIGLLPPSPAFPGSGCPRLQSGRCDGPTVKVFHLHSTTSASRRTCWS